jgi:hypothetical protein
MGNTFSPRRAKMARLPGVAADCGDVGLLYWRKLHSFSFGSVAG